MRSLYTIVGTRHLGGNAKRTLAGMLPRHQLRLVRDPANSADRNAIKVIFGNTHLGYVKATEAAELAPRMDSAGKTEITGLYAVSMDRWPMVEVEE